MPLRAFHHTILDCSATYGQAFCCMQDIIDFFGCAVFVRGLTCSAARVMLEVNDSCSSYLHVDIQHHSPNK